MAGKSSESEETPALPARSSLTGGADFIPLTYVVQETVIAHHAFASCFGPEGLGPSLYPEEGLGPFGAICCCTGQV